MTFMLPADVAAFSVALAPPIDAFAQWETHERDAGIVLHDSLEAAMRHDGVQAFRRIRMLRHGPRPALLRRQRPRAAATAPRGTAYVHGPGERSDACRDVTSPAWQAPHGVVRRPVILTARLR
jgi:hypothetical protein